MRWDKHSDTYQAVSWEDAFAEIGAELQLMAPRSTVFYASGRASLETSYMYQLLARMYGHNNLPDSSNMCHETTSTALPESVGVGVGTVLLQDFDKADCILFFLARTPALTARACCIRCKKHANAACLSLLLIHYANAAWSTL